MSDSVTSHEALDLRCVHVLVSPNHIGDIIFVASALPCFPDTIGRIDTCLLVVCEAVTPNYLPRSGLNLDSCLVLLYLMVSCLQLDEELFLSQSLNVLLRNIYAFRLGVLDCHLTLLDQAMHFGLLTLAFQFSLLLALVQTLLEA